MVDLGTYIFKDLDTEQITPEEYFTNAHVKEVYESDHVRTTTRWLCIILNSEYEKSDLLKVMENQCQHLTMTQRNEYIKLIQKF